MDNVDFYIKRGDRSPEISATLRDKNGAVIDPSGKNVLFKMRSFTTGGLIINDPAEVVTGPKVRYQWQDGDTSDAGYCFAEWEMELSPGITQTFPTLGWHLIDITSDLDNPTIGDADFLDIRRLRRFIAEPSREEYSDSLLHAILLQNNADLNAAAAQVWREKAAEYAHLVDVSESGSSRKMSQLYDRAVKQAELYEVASGTGVSVTLPQRPRVGRIVRSDT